MNAALSLSHCLARFAAETRFEDLPPQTVHAARRALLDALGVSMAAVTLGEGCDAFAELARQQGGRAESTLIGAGARLPAAPVKVPAAMAAFANGALAHALDFEDAHDGALVHPNAATMPAALAVAEQQGADVADFLAAIVVGCEVVCRLGLALRAPLDDFGWYPPPILGAFGATAAAARLYGLTAEQVRDAFSLTLCQATCSAEIKHSPRSLIRGVRDAFAARAGVVSGQLAARGITGFDQPFEGAAGFFAAFARNQYAPEVLTEALGSRFEIERLSFKPWPSCRGTHAFIEATLNLARDHGLTAQRIAAIHLRGSRLNRMLAEPLAAKRRPATAIDARFSLPYTVATALVHGDVGLEHFHSPALADPAVHRLADLVAYRVDAATESAGATMTWGSVRLETVDGHVFETEVRTPLGHPERAVDDAAIEAKFRRCASAAEVPPEQAEGLVKAVRSAGRGAGVRETLAPLLPVHPNTGDPT